MDRTTPEAEMPPHDRPTSDWARSRHLEVAAEFRDRLGLMCDSHTRSLIETTADLLVALEGAFADARAR